jgi:hypothetical protein
VASAAAAQAAANKYLLFSLSFMGFLPDPACMARIATFPLAVVQFRSVTAVNSPRYCRRFLQLC